MAKRRIAGGAADSKYNQMMMVVSRRMRRKATRDEIKRSTEIHILSEEWVKILCVGVLYPVKMLCCVLFVHFFPFLSLIFIFFFLSVCYLYFFTASSSSSHLSKSQDVQIPIDNKHTDLQFL